MLASPTYSSLVAAVVAGGMLSGCTGQAPVMDQEMAPDYKGVSSLRQSGGLVELSVAMTGARGEKDVSEYARCVAAQFAMDHGFGFARHVWTNVVFEAGVWRADAVYTVSSTLPKGLRTIDAEVTVQNCAAEGIPTV